MREVKQGRKSLFAHTVVCRKQNKSYNECVFQGEMREKTVFVVAEIVLSFLDVCPTLSVRLN